MPRGTGGVRRASASADPRRTLLVVALSLLVVPVFASPSAAAADPSAPAPTAGGTLRVAIPDESFFLDLGSPAGLDPVAGGPFAAMALHRCCLSRTLLSHNGQRTEDGGSELHPDLAESLPTISPDGREWAFQLRRGLRYGPPLEDVPITAPDFIRGFHRALSPKNPDNYYAASLFGVIQGARAYAEGTAASISGLEAPDEQTLVIRLDEPSGSLAARLALPLILPVPPSPHDPGAALGIAEGHPEGMGTFLVSTGPYMIEGAEELDFGVPAEQQRPIPGLMKDGPLVLVRDPSWDPVTDPLRPAYADRIEFISSGSLDEAVAAVEEGRADVLWNPALPPTVPPDRTAEFGPGRTFVDAYDLLVGNSMNVAQPPFDDLHVRRAVSLATDKSRFRELAGGPLVFETATHLALDSLEDNLLQGWDPYATSGQAGDVEAARAEMALSRYDTDGDGLCDAEACRGVRAIMRPETQAWADAVKEDLQAIGIDLALDVQPTEGYSARWFDPAARVGLAIWTGWIKDEMNASTFFEMFHSRSIPPDAGNGTLVGASPEQLAAWGYETTEVPQLDDRIEACLPLVGSPQFECWAALDQYVMTQVVPWVPVAVAKFVVVTSPRVTTYSFDQLTVSPAFDRIAVTP